MKKPERLMHRVRLYSETAKQIDQKIAAIEADERFQAPAANVLVNAPLALIQVGLKAQHACLISVKEGWDALVAQHKSSEDLRSEMLDPLLPAHDYRPHGLSNSGKQLYACAKCKHTTPSPARPSFGPCPGVPDGR